MILTLKAISFTKQQTSSKHWTSHSDKSDIWSLGVTLNSLVTGKYPIEPPPQSQSLSLEDNQNKKDARGYSIITTNLSATNQADNFFSDTPLGHEIRKNKADQYLQSTTCENNLRSKHLIDALCKEPYHEEIKQSEVFCYLTSSLLSPIEVRPNAKELSTTMERLVQYFPWDQKNNIEFVKKMTENNALMVEKTHLSLFFEEEKKSIEQRVPKLSAVRQAHKELLDSGLGGPSTASGFFSVPSTQEMNAAPLANKEKKPIEQPISQLSAVRLPHKEIFDHVSGGTSTSSHFFYASARQKTKEEESESESPKKIKTKLWGNNH